MRAERFGARCCGAWLVIAWIGCHAGGARFPWHAPTEHAAFEHAQVHTLNPDYRRTSSRVLVRKIDKATRATLDYAAYHANFMNADAPPEALPTGGEPDASHAFLGLLDRSTITASLRATQLPAQVRAQPLAFAPMVEYLATKDPDAASGLEDVAAAVREESWGLPGGPQFVRQAVSEAFLFEPQGRPAQLWLRIELQPWFKDFGALPDEDGDGYPEIYGRVRADLFKASAATLIRDDYMAKPLGPAEINAWANQLSSYWYPSYNTDLVNPAGPWPEADTESAIRQELGGQTFSSPSIVMRGKPEGQAVYNVFLIEGVGATSAQSARAGAHGAAASPLGSHLPTPMLAHVTSAIADELAAHGGSWAAWTASVSPFTELVRKRLHATPTAIKAVAGEDGFLFFRHELEYAVAGDLGAQAPEKNPIPALVEWKTLLAAHGVDLLFVPVPTKLEVLPDMLDAKLKDSAGTLVNPFGRKLLSDLAAAGIETVDLLPTFLAERVHDADAKEALYQAQDTHWTARGLELAARLLAARIVQYPWYAEFAAKPRPMTTTTVPFSRHGDLVSRLPSALRRAYKPESLVGHQVRYADGTAYDDDADSPVIVLGDSYAGVFELTDCLRAGVSAHIARELAQPVDLVMSYGGGPNVRQTLLRRGVDDLNRRRLVIYLMTARDLYDYPDGWEPLKAK